jgi:hypothetical protein
MREDMRKRGMPVTDRADTVAQAVSRRGSAAPINVEVTPAKASLAI